MKQLKQLFSIPGQEVRYRNTRKFEDGCPNYPDEMCKEFFEELRFAKNEEKIRGNSDNPVINSKILVNYVC